MSRYDDVGMFWQDVYATGNKEKREKRARSRPIPEVPKTGWVCPKEFPNLKHAKVISLDTETKDTGLEIKRGPGQYREGGYICGVSIAVDENNKWYFPMRHERGENMDPERVVAWLKQTLGTDIPKIGANLKYDIEWLATEGVEVRGELHDVQIAEPLIDETQDTFSLDFLGEKYLGEGKVDELLYQWCADAFGGNPTRRSQAGNIWRAPAELVGPYAEYDAAAPLRIFNEQRKILVTDELMDVYNMERALIPMLVAMRQFGIRIDAGKLDPAREFILEREEKIQQALNETLGWTMNVNGRKDLPRAFDQLGLKYNMTAPTGRFPEGQPSFPKKWLQNQRNELSERIIELRKWSTLRGTFVEGYMDKHVLAGGRIHCEFNQLKSDDAGTVARFSSSNPNLQNIPSRDPESARLIRGLFMPEDGCRYRRYDWSQIEYRLIVHYGRGQAAKDARRRYNTDPKTDYHQMVMDMTGLERKPAKAINFGLVYGMGEPTLAYELGMSLEAAKPVFKDYHKKCPFVKDLADRCANIAKKRKYVKTIMGRRAHFPFWEAANWNQRGEVAKNKSYIEENYGRAQVAGLHKAVSRVIQGGAADIMKKAMVDIWTSGVCDVIHPPHLTVHDELGFSDEQTPATEEAFAEVKRIMENCVKLNVPLVADCEVGPNWGDLEELK
jgi:DNA polymerase I-like protein with 3'-5' exonuclease and polymerase domains